MSRAEFLIKAKVRAEAKSDTIRKIAADAFAVSVRASASRGRANRRVAELLGEHLGGRVIIRLVSGHHSPSKIFSVQVLS